MAEPQAGDVRRCGLCGALDTDDIWPVPASTGATSQCTRCASVRFLWHDLAAARAADVRAPAGGS